LAEYLRLSPEPSLALVVVKDDSILFARGYGSEDPSGSEPVDPEATLFWLGSLSKLITADAVKREIDRGRLSLDAAAGNYLGWPLPSRAGWQAVTVRNLLTHTSGLDEPFMAGTAERPEELVSLARYLSRVRWRAGRPPGEVLRYSNHGMALAGLLVERVSGTPFAEYVEREIFGPLAMRHSSFRQPLDPELSRRLAVAGTDARADFLLPAPAGAMVGTAGDMGRFLIGQLDTAGPRAASLREMHATQWRGHPAVPGIALGWFETRLGEVNGLFHTGARHHFSVAWIVPSHRIGVFLVHSMRQGGRFQHLRATVIREFARRYLAPDTIPVVPDSSAAVAGVYRPMLLSTTTVERVGYLALDVPVRVAEDGSVTLRAPGELGTVRAQPAGGSVFEVRNGPQAGLRIGFGSGDGPVRIALGGTLLDPVTLIRLSWWERGLVHGVALGGAALVLTLAGAGYGIRALRRRRQGGPAGRGEPWPFVTAAGAGFALALAAFITAVLTTPEIGAAAHMRNGLWIVLALLSVAWACCLAIPVAAVLRWRPGHGRITWSLLSLAALLAAGLLWHYRLIGFRL
jgi:CubicO group peptidase (beta-lactamase class C family)